MSDGALSQDELEALLGGGDAVASPSVVPSSEFDSKNERPIIDFYNGLYAEFSGTLTDVMNLNVSLTNPEYSEIDNDELVSSIAENVVVIQNDYKGGLKGTHFYIVSKDDALKIAVPMMGQDKLEINGASVGAVAEAISLIASITVKTMGERIQSAVIAEDPNGNGIPRNELNLPEGRLVRIRHHVEIGDKDVVELDEIFGLSVIDDLVKRLESEPEIPQDPQPSKPLESEFNFNVDDLLGGVGGDQQLPGLGVSGAVGSKPNVQNVQLQNLSPATKQSETGNIEMLMDVAMEMTVELGRTRWNIREILNIGEGTIIELEKLAGEPVDILVNGNFIAKGEVVVIDENFGVRVTEILSSAKTTTEA